MNLNEASKISINGILFTLLTILNNSCQKNNLDRNPYLQEFEFEYSVNLNLPQYDNIKYAGGNILIPQIGIKGVYLFNLSGNSFFAWEASCPNHNPNNCSQMKNIGVLIQCECENFKYSLATGQLIDEATEPKKYYPLLNYPVKKNGSNLIISN